MTENKFAVTIAVFREGKFLPSVIYALKNHRKMLICSLIAGIVGHGYDSVGATEKECACSGIIVSGIIAEFGDTSSGPGSYVSAFYVEMQQTVDRCKPHTALAVGDY